MAARGFLGYDHERIEPSDSLPPNDLTRFFVRLPAGLCPLLMLIVAAIGGICGAAAAANDVPAAGSRSADWHRRMLVFLGPEDFDRTATRAQGCNVLHFTEPLTDIGLSTSAHAAHLGPPDVHLPPRLVCGEGPHPENGTLIRVLSRYQVLMEQFAAFPAEVRGGVHVAALRNGGEPLIAVVPAQDKRTHAVRLFDSLGTLVAEAPLPDDMPAPFVITTGRFIRPPDGSEAQATEQVAIASRDQQGGGTRVVVLAASGQRLAEFVLPRAAEPADVTTAATFGTISLTTWHGPDSDLLMVWSQPAAALVLADVSTPAAPRGRTVSLEADRGDSTVHPSAFPSRDVVCAANDDPIRSRLHLFRLATGSSPLPPESRLDIGLRENSFFGKRVPEAAGFVRRGGYGPPEHAMICPAWDLVRKRGDPAVLESDDPALWIPERFAGAAPLARAGLLFPFWSHWHNSWFGNRIGEILDPATGLPRYNVLNERNEVQNDGSIFKGDLSIERQLLLASRVYFWLSAATVRGPGRDAELLIGGTSIHELGSPLDFNPGNLAGFRRHLAYRWGEVATVNRQFGTAFSSWDAVDPPRGQGRGAWDELGARDAAKNPGSDFFQEWRDYNKLAVLSARWMDATRDGLLAGFAPELMKNHRPGFGKDMSAAGLTMGTSTGGSVYSPLPGVDTERVIVTGPNSSGQWNFSYGEYGAGEEHDYEYVRLKWQWKQGLITVNNAPHHGVVEAMLAADGEPRPGQTGGVGQVRAVALPTGERFDIAQIGAGPDRNGLLKSLREDGGFEGSTYVVPFHAHVQTVSLAHGARLGAEESFQTPAVETFSHNDQLEAVIVARADATGGSVRVALAHEGVLVPESTHVFAVGAEPVRLRYCVRGGTRMRNATLVIATSEATATLDVTAQLEQVARHGRTAGVQHRGGVSFDLLDRDCVSRKPFPPLAALPGVAPGSAGGEVDAVPPVWIQPHVAVRFPLDDDIKAVGWIPCIDPDYRVWLTVQGAADNDRIDHYTVSDAATGSLLLTTTDSRPRFRLPPLPPLEPVRLAVHAIDRAGNQSETHAEIAFVTPGIFDFGPEPTTSQSDVMLVRHDQSYAADRGFGWLDTSEIRSRHAGWGRTTLTTCVESARQNPIFRVQLPPGAYRLVPLVGTPEKILRSRFTVKAGTTALTHNVRDWTASVEPCVVMATGEPLDVVLPARHRLFGLVITPAADTTPPTWAGGPPAIRSLSYDARIPENPRHKGSYFFDRAALAVEWPAASDDIRVRHYKLFVNDEVWFATNLTSAHLRGLPVDTPIEIRVAAVDDAGNMAVSPPVSTELDSRTAGTVLLPVTGGTSVGRCEAWLNGLPVPLGDPRTSRGMPTVAIGRIGRNALCVRLMPAGRGLVSIMPDVRFGDRLFDSSAGWRMAAANAVGEPGWLAADYDAAEWSPAKSLAADSPTCFRLEFEISADAPRGELAVASVAARMAAIEAIFDSIVIQQLDFHDLPLKDVVASVNRELTRADQSGFNIRLVADSAVADRAVSLGGTNQTLRMLVSALGRTAGVRSVTSADGTLRLVDTTSVDAP